MAGKDWPELYADYLKSEEWAILREKVMQRCGHCCEGCRDQPAIDVHHLTYEHVTQEFLFELVALCRGCHERIHMQSDRPKVSTWVPRHEGRAAPLVSNLPGALWRRARLEQLAAAHRAKTMAEEPPDDIPERPGDTVYQRSSEPPPPAPAAIPEARYGGEG